MTFSTAKSRGGPLGLLKPQCKKCSLSKSCSSSFFPKIAFSDCSGFETKYIWYQDVGHDYEYDAQSIFRDNYNVPKKSLERR